MIVHEPCWICDGTDIVYVDVLDLSWCRTCFGEVYSDRPEYDPH